jgi:hypothetical protein
MLGISGVAEQLLDPQEGLSSIELVDVQGTLDTTRKRVSEMFWPVVATWYMVFISRHVINVFPSILWNPKVHYRAYKSPPLVPILSQIDLIYTILSYLSKIHFNIILTYV